MGIDIALVLALVLVVLIAAAATVAHQDRRAQRRDALRRRARLTRLGEAEPALLSAPAEHRSPRQFWH
jgi:hypothetical protein